MHADKWGPAGSIFVALCLLDVGPAVAVVAAVALDGLLTDAILLPLLAALLGATIWSLAVDRRYHRNPWTSRTAWLAAALMFGGAWVHPAAVWAGIALLAGAAVYNQVLVGRLPERRRRAREVGQTLG